MKKPFLVGLYALLLVFVLLIPSYASVVDTSSPYSGEYLLAANISTDESTYRSTGRLSYDDQLNTMESILSLYGDSSNEYEVMDVKEENGLTMKQIDPRNLRPKSSGNMIQLVESEQNVQMQSVYTVGEQKNISTYNYINKDYDRKTFILKYSGSHCNIWLESGSLVNITSAQIELLGGEYDNQIYTNMTGYFGTTYDRDADGKTAIVLYDIQDGWDGVDNPYTIGGYFDSEDLFYRNYMDMIHIDTYPKLGQNKSSPDISQSFGTIAHEYQHLINYSYAHLYRNEKEMPLYLNEGLSMAAEHLLYGVLDDRISDYNQSETIKNGQSLFYWGDNNDTISNYALSYLYLQYLRTQTKAFDGGGNAIFKMIIQNSDVTSNVVQKVMNEFYPSITLKDILLNFRMAMVLKEKTGYHGFAGESDFNSVSTQFYTGTGIKLRGGGALIKKLSAPFTHSGQGINIVFAGFSRQPVDTPVASVLSGKIPYGTAVALSCPMSGASIMYTTDGSTPTKTYGNYYYSFSPIKLYSHTTLKAIAYKGDLPVSEVAVYQYEVKSTEPTASIASGRVLKGSQLVLSCTLSGAVIRYTTDGSEPTGDYGSIYTEPVAINGDMTVKAVSYREGLALSDVITMTYYVTAAKPAANLESGTYGIGTQIILSCATPGAAIYYTADGSLPSRTNGILYTEPILLTADITIKTIAFAVDAAESEVAAYTYKALPKVAAPVSSLPAGVVLYNEKTELSCPTAGASIRYTIGTVSYPTTTTGILYTGLISLTNNKTVIRAIAYKDGCIDSDVVEFTYDLKITTPSASVADGTVASGTKVILSCAKTNTFIKYTTDGTNPTRNTGTTYIGAITLTANTTIKAAAFSSYAPYLIESDVAAFTYRVIAVAPAASVSSGTVVYGTQLTLGSASSGASIRYTTDGSAPTAETGIAYDSPIIISDNMTIKAIAYKSDMVASSVSTFTYLVKTDAPKADIAGGTIQSRTKVTLSCAADGAVIYYTTDDTEPSTVNGRIYSASILIQADTTIRARAFRQGFIDSDVAAYAYQLPSLLSVRNFGGSHYEQFYGMAADADGILAVGYTASVDSGDFADISKINGTYSLLAKYDFAGNLIWKQLLGGSNDNKFKSIALAKDGYVAVGSSKSLGTEDWANVTAQTDEDASIAKYDKNGNLLWKKHFGGSGTDVYNAITNFDYFSSVICDTDGYVAVGSSSSHSFGNADWTGFSCKGYKDYEKIYRDAIIVKFDLNGNVLWKNNFGGTTRDEFHSVIRVPGGYVAAGYSQYGSFGTGDWTGISLFGYNTKAILVKFDVNGNVIWKRYFGGSGDNTFYSAAAVGDGIVVVGSSNGFGSGELAGIGGKGVNDGIAVKYDLNGNVIWIRNFGGLGYDEFNSVSPAADGFIVAGYATNTSFGSGDWAGIAGNGYNDAILVKYDLNGNVVYKRHMGGLYNDYYHSAVYANNSYYAVGYSEADSFSAGDLARLTGKGYNDAVVAQYIPPVTAEDEALYVDSYGIYNGNQKIDVISKEGGTYIFKARYARSAQNDTSAVFILTVKSRQKLIGSYVINKTLSGNVTEIEKEIVLPSAAAEPNPEINLIAVKSLETLEPISAKISLFHATDDETLSVDSYGLFSNGVKLDTIPNEAGTYTLKVEYTNNILENTSAVFAIAVKSNHRIIHLYIINKDFEVGGSITLENEISLPTTAAAPNLEIDVMALKSLDMLEPISSKITFSRQ